MKSHLICLAAIFALDFAQAQEPVRGMQEELRRRNIYFGDIDGRESPEFSQAMKRYQKRKGFTASGRGDDDTLRSLGLRPRQPGEAPPDELVWPAEPVLRSDTTINVSETAVEIARETGVAPETIAPRSTLKPTRSQTTSRTTKSRPLTPAPAASSRRLRGKDQRLDPDEIRHFVKAYLAAASDDDLRDELRFYGDRVRYYHNGEVDRRIIEATLRKYNQRWSTHKYSLGQAVSYDEVPGRGEIIVTFRVGFTLKADGGKKVRGTTENRFIINAATEDPRIVAIEERRVRS